MRVNAEGGVPEFSLQNPSNISQSHESRGLQRQLNKNQEISGCCLLDHAKVAANAAAAASASAAAGESACSE